MRKLLLSLGIAGLAISVAAQTEKVLFADDFEWLEPWTTAANVHDWVKISHEIEAESKNLTNKANDVTVYDALLERGYKFVQATHKDKSARTPDKVIYIQTNYLKFGLTGYNAGIVLPAIKDVPADAEIKLAFDWTPMRQGKITDDQNARKYDVAELVIILKNEGEEEVQIPVPPHTLKDGDPYTWMKADVSLDGQKINDKTQITIRQIDSQWPYNAEGTAKVCRYFLDNIKLYAPNGGAGITETLIDDDAPVEYYNLQGVRVTNPENGLYIVRQGNKIAKKIIR